MIVMSSEYVVSCTESGGWTDELVYLVSLGVECMCVKWSLVLVLVLDWTQCLPQGVGGDAWVAGPPERRGMWIQFAHQP